MAFTISSVAQLTEGDCLYSEPTLKLLMESNKLFIRGSLPVTVLLLLCSVFLHHSVCECLFIYPTGVAGNRNAYTRCPVLICGLFNGSVSRTGYVMSNGRIFSE
jgi:hypothetical protein